MSLVDLDPQDLTSVMATQLRTAQISFDGDTETVEDRAFEFLWRSPSSGKREIIRKCCSGARFQNAPLLP